MTTTTNVHGTMLRPGDDGYDETRKVWNAAIDHRPAVIARCSSPADVAAALEYGQVNGLEIGVRGGGHNYGGAAVPEDGLMIDLRGLDQVVVDPATRRARCGGGATQAQLDAAAQAHGLAVTGGTISHTGVGGLTLGGGMGWLTRAHGLTIDNLVSAEIVLPDGRCVRACADEHPDLLWAVKGGGGNFGVVTEFELQLHPVGPMVHLGILLWDAEHAGEGLRVARDVANGLPRDAGAIIVALNAPPAPFIPQEHHFALCVGLFVVGLSSADAHATLLAPARAVPPMVDFTTELPYCALQQLLDEAAPYGAAHAYNRALYLDDLTDAAIDVLAERLPRKASPMSLIPIFSLGGAFADVPDDATAFGGRRSARFAVNMDAIGPDADTMAADRQWVQELWTALLPHAGGPGSYVNFMTEYEQDRVRAAYGTAKYDRLAAIKAVYDPDNVLHRNANIVPMR
ncbi:FAD/FMN-containing dehydrogenase [Pseudonocardia thermophila]|jgi:FAD/FMN-containing dehydrogenases|uniref:FAD/FMN-containing dehydrogenase n=1 Tax=Pseudonocardia thermophila TaxID=1848 RepID=A0A1M6YSI8_PSETH|nr:FAD-binding oxidoreductase [Pseudonocardia thermophila]SHL21100.1 FAD/FMN-containing dehydrogenase [Pseudonocardia thermophila]